MVHRFIGPVVCSAIIPRDRFSDTQPQAIPYSAHIICLPSQCNGQVTQYPNSDHCNK